MKLSLIETLKPIPLVIAPPLTLLVNLVQEVKILTNLVYLEKLIMILLCLCCTIVDFCTKLHKK